MTRLVLWRHGQTDWNAEGRLQGVADVPLNEVGRRQAETAAAVLADFAPTHLYSSDLSRAYDTAMVLARRTGLEVVTDAGLREINVGQWAGLTGDETAAVEPRFRQWLADGVDFRRSATGETGTELGRRICGTVQRLLADHSNDDVVVVVTHGMAARVGACFLMGLDFTAASQFRGLHNCGWVVLERSAAGRWLLEAYNVTAEPPSTDPRVSR